MEKPRVVVALPVKDKTRGTDANQNFIVIFIAALFCVVWSHRLIRPCFLSGLSPCSLVTVGGSFVIHEAGRSTIFASRVWNTRMVPNTG
jgi:hypothetical protein